MNFKGLKASEVYKVPYFLKGYNNHYWFFLEILNNSNNIINF